MFSLTMLMMPSAAFSSPMPSASASLPTAFSASARSMRMSPPSFELCRQVAEHHIGVGHGRLLAALGVGRGSGIGAGRLRSDAQCLGELRHIGNRSAAGSHCPHVDGRRPNRHVGNAGFTAGARHSVLDQRHVGGRTAHVEGEDIRVAGALGNAERSGNPAGGS